VSKANETKLISATLQKICEVGLIGDLGQTPTIEIKEMGDRAVTVSGTANNIDTEYFKVVIWVHTIYWYVQPTTASPLTDICQDGSWEMSGHSGDRVLALLVDTRLYDSGSGKTGEYPADAPGVVAFDDQIPPGSYIPCEGEWHGIIGDLSSPPEITITRLDSRAVWFEGTANNIDTSRHRVVLWVKTNIWYIQPWTAAPYTEICPDGKWANSSHRGNIGVALLVDETYQPQNTRRDHPANAPGVLDWDEKVPPF